MLGEIVCIVAHRAAAERLKEWINRYIISEDVELDELTHSYIVRSLIDPQAISIDANKMLEYSGLHTGRWDSTFGTFGMRRYLIQAPAKTEFDAVVRSAGIRHLTLTEYTALRVAEGVPSCPEELNDGHNPLESGLQGSVSFTKGCYIGQEVVARLDSYDKVQRALVVLAVSPGDAEISAGAEIFGPDGVVGTVTSVGGTRGVSGVVVVMGFVERGSCERPEALAVHAASGRRSATLIGVSGGMGNPGSTPA